METPPLDPSEFWNQLLGVNPWLNALGFQLSWFQDVLARTGGNPDAVVAEIRSDERYRARFKGIFREDGTMRMTEREYLDTEQAYRTLFRQFAPEYEHLLDDPDTLVALFNSEQSPNELAQRLDVYAQLRDGSQEVRDAFFVYAGIDITVDDLFDAVVNEDMAEDLRRRYIAGSSNLTYEDYISRTATLAQERAGVLGKSGLMTLDETRQLLDVLNSNGDDDRELSLQELLAAFEEALIGSAATAAGLNLPTKERIAALRQAGVTRAQAQQQYLQFALRGGSLSANAQRAGVGRIDQDRFERAAFLGDAEAARAITTGEAYGEAVGRAGGVFRFDIDEQGGLFQRGLTAV